jgi:hypothetical protein
LLQAGVDLAVIALWLGHERSETTHRYLEADLATKERALQKLAPAGVEVPRFRAKDDVLAFLATLGLCAAKNDENPLTRTFATLTSHTVEVCIIVGEWATSSEALISPWLGKEMLSLSSPPRRTVRTGHLVHGSNSSPKVQGL